MCAKSLQLCLTLCDPMDCSLPGSSAHGILPARILGWVAMLSSRGSSRPRDRIHISCVFCIERQVLYHWHPLGSPYLKYSSVYISIPIFQKGPFKRDAGKSEGRGWKQRSLRGRKRDLKILFWWFWRWRKGPQAKECRQPVEARKGTKEKVSGAQPCLCDPIDYNLQGSFVHGILQTKYWNGLPFPSPGDLPKPGIKSRPSALQAVSLPCETLGKQKRHRNRLSPRTSRRNAAPLTHLNFWPPEWNKFVLI